MTNCTQQSQQRKDTAALALNSLLCADVPLRNCSFTHSSTTVCCMPDQTALRCCCIQSFKSFKSHWKWSLSILLLAPNLQTHTNF